MLALTCERAGVEDGMDAARPRLRLGVAHVLARRALPGLADPRRLELARPAGVHRAARAAAERRGRHRRRERLRAGPSASTGCSRSRCSSTCATTRRCSAASRPGSSRAAGFFVARLQPPAARVPVRRRLDGAEVLHRREHALARPAARASSATSRCREHWRRRRRALRAHGRGLARAAGRERASRRCAVLADAYGPQRRRRWFANWRVFFLACAELWGYRGGREWGVSHYLFEPRPASLSAGSAGGA